MVIVTDPKERGRFLKFAAVGAIGAVIDFGTFNLLTLLTTIPAVVASMISFSAAVCSNFVWNRYWTYPDSRSKSLRRQLVQFFSLNVIGLIIRTPLFAFLEKVLVSAFSAMRIPAPLTPLLLGHNLSLAIAIVVVMMWNFFANRYWTYNDVG